MKRLIRTSILVTIVFMLLCGVIYPLATTVIGQVFFNKKANGSIVSYDGKAVGSQLIGQNFTDDRFFKARPSAVNYNTYTAEDKKPDANGKVNYLGISSGGSNLAPSNKKLSDRVKKDINDFLKSHQDIKEDQIPEDLLTESASGLDPDISTEAAKVQIDTVSKATGISSTELKSIVDKNTKRKTFGIFGEARVNVLMTNLEIAQKLKNSGKL